MLWRVSITLLSNALFFEVSGTSSVALTPKAPMTLKAPLRRLVPASGTPATCVVPFVSTNKEIWLRPDRVLNVATMTQVAALRSIKLAQMKRQYLGFFTLSIPENGLLVAR